MIDEVKHEAWGCKSGRQVELHEDLKSRKAADLRIFARIKHCNLLARFKRNIFNNVAIY